MDTAPTIRVGGAIGLPGVAKALGLDLDQVISEAGLPADVFDDPENVIPYAALADLIARCVALTGCHHIGLLVGEQNPPSALGRIGFVIINSPDVRSALEVLVKHLQYHDRGATVSLRTENGFAFLSYTILDPLLAGAEQIADGAIATGLNIMRALCGADWRPSEVLLAHRAPAITAPFKRVFGLAVRFDAEENALVFPSRWLDAQVKAVEPLLRRLLLAELKPLEDSVRLDLVQEVTRVIPAMMGSRQCTAASIARLFGLTERSLQRHLAQQSTSFQGLLEQVRRQDATRLLRNTTLPLSQVAARLGYSEASAFSRAFRRWEGVSPDQWRSAYLNGG